MVDSEAVEIAVRHIQKDGVPRKQRWLKRSTKTRLKNALFEAEKFGEVIVQWRPRNSNELMELADRSAKQALKIGNVPQGGERVLWRRDDPWQTNELMRRDFVEYPEPNDPTVFGSPGSTRPCW